MLPVISSARADPTPDNSVPARHSSVRLERNVFITVACPCIIGAPTAGASGPDSAGTVPREAARAFPGVPLLFNWAEGGKTPPVSLARLTELGYRIVIFPISTLLAATAAMRAILREIAASGTPAAALAGLPTFGEFVDFIGLPQVREAEQRYAT